MKCCQQARISVWSLGISTQLAHYICSCSTCSQMQKQHAKTILPIDLHALSLPWQTKAANFFEYKSGTYLLVIDHYSQFIELALINSMTTSQTILLLRSISSCHGFPDEIVTDNGTQFSSREFPSLFKSTALRWWFPVLPRHCAVLQIAVWIHL